MQCLFEQQMLQMTIEQAIRQKRFSSAHQKVMVNLLYTSNWLNDSFKQRLKPFDLTPQQFNVLRILKGKHPETLNAGEIKEVMIDKTPDLTRLVDRMVSKDLVSREVCAENRRQVNIGITIKGISLLEKASVEVKNHEDTFGVLSEEEAEQLSEYLDKLRSQ